MKRGEKSAVALALTLGTLTMWAAIQSRASHFTTARVNVKTGQFHCFPTVVAERLSSPVWQTTQNLICIF